MIRWPEDDRHARQHIEQGLPLLEAAKELCVQRRRAVQAGGCVGLYPLLLSHDFARVDTFEPDEANAQLLCENVRHVPNIYVHTDALSDQRRQWRMIGHAGNCGACYLEPLNDGEVASVLLDDYGWHDVDLLQIDVEGHELAVLCGAEQTLMRCLPVVMLEEYGAHAMRYGARPDSARLWLEARGWRVVERSESDVVMVWRSATN